jgi:predicted transcriptional regulator
VDLDPVSFVYLDVERTTRQLQHYSLTLNEWAALAGVQRQTIYRALAGKRLRRETLVKLLAALDRAPRRRPGRLVAV